MLKRIQMEEDRELTEERELTQYREAPEGGKLVRVKSLRRYGTAYFILGFAACAIISVVIIFVILGGKIVTGSQAEYLEGLNETYGKNYQMQKLLDEEALYDLDTSGLSEAISYAIVSGLKDDKYAMYFTKEEAEEFGKMYTDSYTGVGLVIYENDNGQLEVDRTLSDGPADKAGVKAGDIITEIDGKAPENSDDAVEMLAGDSGTKVTVTVSRNGKSKEFVMYRTEVEEQSVEYLVYDENNGIGYVLVSSFREGTADAVKLAVKDLKNKGCDKIIFDLRSNTGGITEEGLDMADYLLPSCTIMKEKIKGKKMKTHTSDESSCGVKYVMLVDGYTASASEIVTAAVKDNAGGTIIGSKTYGKGLIQSMQEFNDGSAVKYTIGEYFSPKGTKIDGVGIEPDIASEDPLATAVQELTK